ncbi:MAG: OmpA family protein [Deltaproteobacteria bacterium]|nr:OmpA family protein [Deltaproteobacteria bacterium]MBW2673278.1 OmpA family protein [Deltaproteobacteria bacterium]
MAIGRKKPEDQGGKWLLTFNDMVTLLLTFFVLILSLSKLDAPKVMKATYSIRAIFNMAERGEQADVQVFAPFVVPMGSRDLKFEREKKELAERINKVAQAVAKTIGGGAVVVPGEGLLSWKSIMDARVVEGGVSVALGEKLLFETGNAEIEERNQPALKILCSILQEIDCQIRVEGNTDEVPISNEQFPSNWELSVGRAVSVVKYFISEGFIPPERLSAAGYADSRPRFPAVNDRNRELNRRVEVLLMLNRDEEGGRGNG